MEVGIGGGASVWDEIIMASGLHVGFSSVRPRESGGRPPNLMWSTTSSCENGPDSAC